MAKKFVRTFFIATILFALILTLINVSIDPQGIYHTRTTYKAIDNRLLGRLANGFNIRFHDYDTVIAGTSRVQSGIDPRSDAFHGASVYNVSLGDTDINEIVTMLSFTLEHQPHLKTLYVGLDLHPFSKHRYPHISYQDAPFNPKNSIWLKWMQYNFSIDAITDDIKATFKRDSERYWVNGHYHSDARVDYPKMTHFILWHYMQEPSMFGCFEYDHQKMQALESILKKFVNKGVDVHLFISPQHAKNLMMLDLLNQFDTYFHWMRETLNLCDTLNSLEKNSCDLWNFSGFNAITTERIADDNKTQMQHYFETSHYKDNVGELIIQTIATKHPINRFGQQMTDASIDAIINTMQFNIKHYKTQASKDFNDLIQIYNQSNERRNKQCAELCQ